MINILSSSLIVFCVLMGSLHADVTGKFGWQPYNAERAKAAVRNADGAVICRYMNGEYFTSGVMGDAPKVRCMDAWNESQFSETFEVFLLDAASKSPLYIAGKRITYRLDVSVADPDKKIYEAETAIQIKLKNGKMMTTGSRSYFSWDEKIITTYSFTSDTDWTGDEQVLISGKPTPLKALLKASENMQEAETGKPKVTSYQNHEVMAIYNEEFDSSNRPRIQIYTTTGESF